MTETTDLSELPPSAKYVYHVIEAEGDGSLARQELREETELADTTLDRAIESLQNGDYLFKSRDSNDLRQVVYHIGDDPET